MYALPEKIFFLFDGFKQKLCFSIYDKSGITGKSTGAEDLISILSDVPQSCSDAGEDSPSVSGQAGTLAPSTPILVSPRSGNSAPTQHRASLLQAYADSTADAGTARRHSHDGGRVISASFTSCGVSPAPEVLEPVSLGLPCTALQPQSPVLTTKPESVYSITSLPSLPAGLAGDESVDTWWT